MIFGFTCVYFLLIRIATPRKFEEKIEEILEDRGFYPQRLTPYSPYWGHSRLSSLKFPITFIFKLV